MWCWKSNWHYRERIWSDRHFGKFDNVVTKFYEEFRKIGHNKNSDSARLFCTLINTFWQVNNAGIMEYGSIENTSLEQFDRLMNINVRYDAKLSTLLRSFCSFHSKLSRNSAHNQKSSITKYQYKKLNWRKCIAVIWTFSLSGDISQFLFSIPN